MSRGTWGAPSFFARPGRADALPAAAPRRVDVFVRLATCRASSRAGRPPSLRGRGSRRRAHRLTLRCLPQIAAACVLVPASGRLLRRSARQLVQRARQLHRARLDGGERRRRIRRRARPKQADPHQHRRERRAEIVRQPREVLLLRAARDGARPLLLRPPAQELSGKAFGGVCDEEEARRVGGVSGGKGGRKGRQGWGAVVVEPRCPPPASLRSAAPPRCRARRRSPAARAPGGGRGGSVEPVSSAARRREPGDWP